MSVEHSINKHYDYCCFCFIIITTTTTASIISYGQDENSLLVHNNYKPLYIKQIIKIMAYVYTIGGQHVSVSVSAAKNSAYVLSLILSQLKKWIVLSVCDTSPMFCSSSSMYDL